MRTIRAWAATDVPTRVEREDLASGRRELFRILSPADAAGVLGFLGVSLSADGKAYAYADRRELSTLFVVQGAR